MRGVRLGDTVRVRDRWQGCVTGTMTLGPNEAGGEIKRSVCVQIISRLDGSPAGAPCWVPIEDVSVVEKAKR